MTLLRKSLIALSVGSILSIGVVYGEPINSGSAVNSSLIANRGGGEHREGMQEMHPKARSSSQKDFDRSEINAHGAPGSYNRGMEAGEAVGGAAAGGYGDQPQTIVQPIQYVPAQPPNM
jgi:hypothetical protein